MPHPTGMKARRVSTGTYDPDSETIVIDEFAGEVRFGGQLVRMGRDIGTTRVLKKVNEQKYLLLLVMPAVVWLFVFAYMPIYGVIIAFKDYNVGIGIWGSPWSGLDHFRDLFHG